MSYTPKARITVMFEFDLVKENYASLAAVESSDTEDQILQKICDSIVEDAPLTVKASIVRKEIL